MVYRIVQRLNFLTKKNDVTLQSYWQKPDIGQHCRSGKRLTVKRRIRNQHPLIAEGSVSTGREILRDVNRKYLFNFFCACIWRCAHH